MEFSNLNDPSAKRDELVKIEPTYRMIQDCLAGSLAVKARRTEYLPQPNACDDSVENYNRYQAYLMRAVFYNLVGETNEMFQGQLQLKPPKIVLPELLEPLRENADGQGLSLSQLIKDASACVVPYSRGGWYIDFPQLPTGRQGFTREDLANGLMPTIRFIKPWDIINWQEEKVGNKKQVTLIVIKEDVEYRKQGHLKVELKCRYIVMVLEGLRKNRANVYVVSVPDDRQANKFIWERHILRDATGETMTRLPFSPIGAQNNDMSVDHPLFDTMATLNLAHYRASADFYESAFQLGQPTPVIIGLTEHWATNVLKKNIQLGSTTFLPLPENADAKLLQVEGNTLAQEAMSELLNQMIMAGADVVQRQPTVERKEAEIDAEGSAKTSKLGKIASNLEASLIDALRVANSFISTTELGPDELQVYINKVFNAGAKSTSQLRELNELYNSENPALTFEEWRAQLRLAGIADEMDSEARAKIEADQTARDARVIAMRPPPVDNSSSSSSNRNDSGDE